LSIRIALPPDAKNADTAAGVDRLYADVTVRVRVGASIHRRAMASVIIDGR